MMGGNTICSGTIDFDGFRGIQGTGQGVPHVASGGVVTNSIINCGDAFPFTKIDVVTDSYLYSCGGQTSTSNYVTTSLKNLIIDNSAQDYTFSSRTINLGNAVNIDNVQFVATSTKDYWHFNTVLSNSIINITNSKFDGSVIKLNSSSFVNIDKVYGDLVNIATSTPSPEFSVNVSNNIGGQVNIAITPESTTQLVRSIAGNIQNNIAYATPYGGTAEVYNATASSFLPTACWTNTAGSAPTTDGTQFTVVDNNAFTWKRNDRNDSGINGRLSGWSWLGGILKVTIQSPSSGAHLSASLQVKLDTTNGVGASTVLNKQLYIPRSSASEAVILWLPYLGGYWLTANPIDTQCAY
jgi:hypothetical protein